MAMKKEISPFIRLLIKLGCVTMPRPRNKKTHWITTSGQLVTTSGSIIVQDAKQISRTAYNKIKNEKREKAEKIETEIAKNGCYIDEEDNVWI